MASGPVLWTAHHHNNACCLGGMWFDKNTDKSLLSPREGDCIFGVVHDAPDSEEISRIAQMVASISGGTTSTSVVCQNAGPSTTFLLTK